MFERSFPSRVIVAIPVKNEAERIAACLHALSDQVGLARIVALPFEVLLFVNNSDDCTAEIAEALAPSLAFTLTVVSAVLPPDDANAGAARRHAMELAARRLEEGGDDGILMTTDADSRVAPNWIAANLDALEQGVDAVAGTVVLEPKDEAALPSRLKARAALEGRYQNLVCKLETLLDPAPHDPWPRHQTQSGASLALTLKSFRAIGGVPNRALGEDRALVAALQHHGFLVRHAPEVKAITSGRLYGRAAGGCADTMRWRIERPDAECDGYLRPAFDVWRGTARNPHSASRALRPDELPGQIRRIRLILGWMSIAQGGRRLWDHLASRVNRVATSLTKQSDPTSSIVPPLNPDGGTAAS